MLEARSVRRGREFWRRLVAEVKSGASVADVARRHMVQPRTLSWWKWRLADEVRAPVLLPVVVRRPAPLAEEACPIELRIGDVLIRVRSDTDVKYVAALVDALRG